MAGTIETLRIVGEETSYPPFEYPPVPSFWESVDPWYAVALGLWLLGSTSVVVGAIMLFVLALTGVVE